MKEGLYAYLMKPLNAEELNLVLRRAIENTFLLIQAGQRKYYQDIATMDGLTGVYNHRHFHEMLDWNISHLNRSPQAFSIFIIDLDDFKKYNDTKGHVEGDKLLHSFAQLLVSSTRDNDMVFRYGGEEFAVIMSQTDQFSAQKAGERLLAIVRSRLPVTMSMGLASFPMNAQIKSELVVRADKALYRAKTTGKNRLCTYDERVDK
jgi:diguanylate cyclase (GGDEF)-like protein